MKKIKKNHLGQIVVLMLLVLIVCVGCDNSAEESTDTEHPNELVGLWETDVERSLKIRGYHPYEYAEADLGLYEIIRLHENGRAEWYLDKNPIDMGIKEPAYCSWRLEGNTLLFEDEALSEPVEHSSYITNDGDPYLYIDHAQLYLKKRDKPELE